MPLIEIVTKQEHRTVKLNIDLEFLESNGQACKIIILYLDVDQVGKGLKR